MTVDEREAKEAEEFRTGPLSVLTNSVKTNSQVCFLGVFTHLLIGWCMQAGLQGFTRIRTRTAAPEAAAQQQRHCVSSDKHLY